MTPSALRLVLRLVAAAGIPGIIVGSIAENDGVAITFGAITAVAAFGLILVTAATTRAAGDVDEAGAAMEERIDALVAKGADEAEVRALVADVVRFARHEADT